MRPNLFTLGASLVLGVDSLTLVKKDNPSIVSFPFERSLGIPVSRNRRRGTVETPLNNEKLVYTVTLQLGTPPQTTRVQLDTGSSDLVVETDSSNLCASQPYVCIERGAYNANSSSTYQYLNSDFEVAYGGGDGASGDNALDILNIGAAVIQNMQFGIMYTTTVLEGILGVSFTEIEGQVENFGDPAYNNLPVLLVQQGYIDSRAFSVYLNDDTGTGGTILFGGVDTKKYQGNLVTLPLVPAAGSTDVDQFFVTLLNVQMTDANGNIIILPETVGAIPVPALLDTGTTDTILPQSIASAIYNVLNADLSSPPGVYVDCSLANTSSTVDFVFAGITIHVPLSQLIVPNGPGQTYTECPLGIDAAPASDPTVILGDTFLSSAYVVFDLDNKEASLAQTNFNSNSENILQITTGPNAVPHAPGVGASSSSSSSTSSSSSSTFLSSSRSTSSSSSRSTSSSSSSTKALSTSSSLTSSVSSTKSLSTASLTITSSSHISTSSSSSTHSSTVGSTSSTRSSSKTSSSGTFSSTSSSKTSLSSTSFSRSTSSSSPTKALSTSSKSISSTKSLSTASPTSTSSSHASTSSSSSTHSSTVSSTSSTSSSSKTSSSRSLSSTSSSKTSISSSTKVSSSKSSSPSSTSSRKSSLSSRKTSITTTSSSVSSTSSSSKSSSISKSAPSSPSSTRSSSKISSTLSSSKTYSRSSTRLSSTSSSISTKLSSTTSSAPVASWSGTPAVGTTIKGIEYLGCVAETIPRTLMSASYSDGKGMTIESCAAFCYASNYGLAGVEYAQQCFCGDALSNGGTVGATGCTMPCPGNSNEFCGGSDRLSLFGITYYVPPSNPQEVENYMYQGCYHEPATGGRLLSGHSYVDTDAMTVESCIAFCRSQTPTQTWAGVEYAQECYCSTSLPTGAVLEPDGTCATLCRGNDKEFCGGNDVLNVYTAIIRKQTRRRGARSLH